MEQIGRSIQGRMQAIGNFARSFTAKSDADVREPADVMVPSESGGEKDWTVLVYAEGRDRLAYSTNLALNKMEHIGSDAAVNVVAQATVEPTLFERFAPGMERVNTRRYYITKDRDQQKITSPVVGDLGARVPLNTDTLADFLQWGVKTFPAKHTMVVIKKHGLGFAKTDRHVPLSARELSDALGRVEKDTGKKVDVVSFDSCSMEQLEVASQLEGHAKAMTASQEDIFAVDYPYDRILWGLEKNSSATARDVGDLVVRAHRDGVPGGIQTALDLEKVRDVEEATRELVETLIHEKVPRELIYTCMLRSPSMEPGESMRFAFNFRDARGFVDNVLDEKAIASPDVREKAGALKEKLAGAVIAHHIGEGKKRIKDGQGISLYMPWQEPAASMKESYGKLEFAGSAAWMQLIDYVFESPAVTGTVAREVERAAGALPAPQGKDAPPVEKLSVGRRIGKSLIRGYKQYVSAYLMTACKHTPSCSQYGREAIEKHGLVQGSKMAFMRILSCNDKADGRYDPVPDDPARGNEPLGAPPPEALEKSLPGVIISPPATAAKSKLRKNVESALISGAELAGKVLGGAACALAALPIGMAMGGVIGARAGTDTIDTMNRSLLERYHADSVRQFVKIEHALGDPGYGTYNFVKRFAHSETAARVVGGAVGALAGLALGAAGGAWKGRSWGSRLGGLFARNLVKDSLGELPKHPATENVLRRYYDR